MSTQGDTQRLIADWLEAQVPERAPKQLIDASRARISATPQRRAWWSVRPGAGLTTFARLGIAAVVVVATVGVAGLALQPGPIVGPAATSPSPTPSPTASPTSSPSVASPSSSVDESADGGVDGQWPQGPDDDLQAAQDGANAGDPAYSWQVDPAIAYVNGDHGPALHEDGTTPAIIDRFLRERLGWSAYLLDTRVTVPYESEIGIHDLVYLRCKPDATNPLYPTAHDPASGGEACAPTIDSMHYESVRIDITQPELKGPDGIWVVNEWSRLEPLTQVDPSVGETDVTARLEAWLAARIAGTGAEGTVATEDDRGDGRCSGRLDAMCRIDEVPLLYATSSGAPYERYEIERLAGPRWPDGEMEFTVRLFADEGATVVEQPVMWIDQRDPDGRVELEFLSLVTAMTENGRPVPVRYRFFDGEVAASAARPWQVSHQMFNYGLSLNGQYEAERLTFVPDPYAVTATCTKSGTPGDAAELAQLIASGPGFEATAPVPVTVGGATGLSLDVTLTPGMSVCRGDEGESSVLQSSVSYPYVGGSWRALIHPDSRVRLYLLDMPEGSSMRLMGIVIGAPKPSFERVVEAAAPVLESMEFIAP